MKAVQMMGGAPSRVIYPPPPEGVERWGLNNLFMSPLLRQRFNGWTRWFDLHTNDHIKARRLKAYGWLTKQTKPVYRWDLDPEIPGCVVYPQAARNGSRLFCSTLDWMLALAIYEKFDQIDLYEFRMDHTAYVYQQPSAQWWMREAQEHGIEVKIHGKSRLKLTTKPHTPIVIPKGCLMYGLETVDRSKLYHAG